MLIQLILALSLTAPPLPAGSAATQSHSQLLEEGIYQEETVGDLTAAIEIYKLLLADAEKARPQAAQAQFRLGVCYLKSAEKDKAQAAFEQLIADYPDAEELIARARGYLPAKFAAMEFGPAPWRDGEVLRLDIKLASGKKIGNFFFSANSAVVGERSVWRLGIRRDVTIGGNNQGVSSVDVDFETLRPLTSSFQHTVLGRASAVYSPTEIVVTYEDKETSTKTFPLDCPVFDSEQTIQIPRMLPLEVGYRVDVPYFHLVLGAANQAYELEVVGEETLTTPAGIFECFKIELSIGQTYWYSKDANRTLVRFDVEGLRVELAEITNRPLNGPYHHVNHELGFSLALPMGWGCAEFEKGGRGSLVLRLLDPTVHAGNHAEIDPRPDHSVQYRAERELGGVQRRDKSYTLREETWTETSIGGFPAISFVGDFLSDDEEWVEYRAYIYTERLATEFIFKMPKEKFVGMLYDVQTIVQSWREEPL
jgi:hypothetical protein